jgi:ribose-phosphate pyrophosphokinase
MIILNGSSSSILSAALAEQTSAILGEVEQKRFPDNEGYVRIRSPLDGQDVVVVSNTYPDERLVETLMICDAVSEFDYSSFVLVVPYYGYARQDKKFDSGEPISARAFARALEIYPDKLLTVDIHAVSILEWFESAQAVNVSAAAEMAGKLKEIGVDFVLSPDRGRISTAKRIGELTGLPSDYLVKERIDGNTVRMDPKALDVRDKRVAVVDDIISTGGTIVNAANELKRLGASRVVAACTHGLFASNALDRLSDCCDLVVSSDTLENPTTAFSVAPSLARELSKMA